MGDDAAHVADKNGFAIVNAVGKGDRIRVDQPQRFKAGITLFQQRPAQPVAISRIGVPRPRLTNMRVEDVLKPALRLMVLARLAQAMRDQERQVEKQIPVEGAVGAVEINRCRRRRNARWLRLKGVLRIPRQQLVDGNGGFGHQFRAKQRVEAYPLERCQIQRLNIEELCTAWLFADQWNGTGIRGLLDYDVIAVTAITAVGTFAPHNAQGLADRITGPAVFNPGGLKPPLQFAQCFPIVRRDRFAILHF
ncbi:hypothetical protein D3C76_1020790 [compost metagenome]